MTNRNSGVRPDFEKKVKDIIGEIKGYGFGMLNDMIDPQYVECDPEKMTCKSDTKSSSGKTTDAARSTAALSRR